MEYTNGYFQLDIREDGTYIRLYPPKEGGEAISINEVMGYLEKVKITDYRLPEINAAITNLSKNRLVKITDRVVPECEEKIVIKVAKDKMFAILRIYPPSVKGNICDKKGIMAEVSIAKLKYGVSEKVIDYILEKKEYCRDYIFAKGLKPVEGKSANIQYHFDTNPTSKPQLLDDGTIDFHKLNIFSSVKQGDILATLIPMDEGKPGMDVYGNVISPLKVKNAYLKHGRNIAVSNDGLNLISQINGDVKLEGDTVFVSDTYTVAADVDVSTGDIEYEGNIVVTGNVRSGFTVRAKGDIEVRGVVEAGFLYAGGNIILKRGMQGMGKGILDAGQDVVTKFIENGNVYAGKKVNTGSILHSVVEAKDEVIVSGKTGFVIGGNIIAKNNIKASSIGNQMGMVTNLKIGVDPKLIEEAKKLEKEIERLEEEKLKIVQMLELFKKRLSEGKKLNNDQMRLLKDASIKVKNVEEGIALTSTKLDECDDIINEKSDGRIVVTGTIYPGVRISISNRNYYVREERHHCQFRLDDEVVVVSSC